MNCEDKDEAAHYELPHLGLHYLPSLVFDMYVVGLKYFFFSNLSVVNFVLCFLSALGVRKYKRMLTYKYAPYSKATSTLFFLSV